MYPNPNEKYSLSPDHYLRLQELQILIKSNMLKPTANVVLLVFGFTPTNAQMHVTVVT